MNTRAKKILLLAFAAVLLTANGFLLPVLNRQRAALGITRVAPLENAPPMLALTTQVLGGFRGLIANALWIRSNQLQEEGKYFEQVQLADWITKLEPHIVQVWLVQAWNMAFNISVKFSEYPDRWRWVQRGMELLRDEGLRYNPDQPLIYAELAWLFQFKMGQNLDDGHNYYKAAWAYEMMRLFGGEKPNFDKLIQPQTPEEQQRAALLRDKYKMDPAWMRTLNERYGPLDWRLPEAHAIYWAATGLDRSKKDEDMRRLRSAIYQSMNLSFQRGRMVLSSNTPPRLLPNLEIVPRVNAAFEEQLANDPLKLDNVRKAHRNFLRDVPYQFFLFNRLREGEQWLRFARERYPDAIPPGLTLAEYVVDRATRDNGYVQVAASFQDRHDLFFGVRQDHHHRQLTKGSQRIRLTPIDELKVIVARDMLAPESGLTDEEKARLRTLVPAATQSAAPAPAPQK